MSERYVVVGGSQLGHGCCFVATVVDTARPVMANGEHLEDAQGAMYAVMCECLETFDAAYIANALNEWRAK